MAEAIAASVMPDYGLDAPLLVKRMFSRAGWTFAIGVSLFVMNRAEYPGPATRLFAVLGLIALVFAGIGGFMVWSSRVAKLKLRDELIDSLELKGDEKVLDVGCGRGLMLIGIAKRLRTGRVTGVDVWSQEDLSGNSLEAVKENAKLENVAERVRVETCPAQKLHYPDKNYDVVVSTMAIHNIDESEDRDQAVSEMWRVLKPGGRLLIVDILHTGDYAGQLRKAGAKDVTVRSHGVLWCLPVKSVAASK